ncbi:MAG: bifunctional phosphoribosyl-AMP cyclohydrolase/phosphoribosyl-ATP diphosphatase HisIE [Nitrospirae bacterium]|nr:bifunctional phosphoribosyl-AMP cyclohydrolase/phosphoribosyl-ATP diphosphatase HisIE [Candidatus Troglogloeales bacterium]
MKKSINLINSKNISKSIQSLKFVNGLIPAVIQDHKKKDVLMVAYMNKESLQKTLETGETYFYSRSRKRLWHKVETSGHIQKVKAVHADCDGDTLLVEVEQVAAACHTGNRSCFFTEMPVAETLYETVLERKKTPSSASYTSSLFKGGIDLILKKVGEEAGEFMISAKNKKKSAIIHETADLLYHLLVTLCYHNITLDQIESELTKRTGQSGIAEKQSRRK